MAGKLLEFLGYLIILLPAVLTIFGVVDLSSEGKKELAQIGVFSLCLLGTALVFIGKAASK